MHASVPELTIRTFSTLGTQAFTNRAIHTSASVGMPKLVPLSAASFIASMMAGFACPKIAGPHVPT